MRGGTAWAHEANKRFLKCFGEWWRLMAPYSVVLLLVGILLKQGLLHDEAFFALCAVAVNLLKLYRLNCLRDAPDIRGYLARALFTLGTSALPYDRRTRGNH